MYRNPNIPNDAGQYNRWPVYSERSKPYKTLSLNFENGEFLKEDNCHFWDYQMPKQHIFTGKQLSSYYIYLVIHIAGVNLGNTTLSV